MKLNSSAFPHAHLLSTKRLFQLRDLIVSPKLEARF
jgi:type III secretory pathway lipoprotein EscJ